MAGRTVAVTVLSRAYRKVADNRAKLTTNHATPVILRPVTASADPDGSLAVASCRGFSTGSLVDEAAVCVGGMMQVRSWPTDPSVVASEGFKPGRKSGLDLSSRADGLARGNPKVSRVIVDQNIQ
jgi:hypothetical protein